MTHESTSERSGSERDGVPLPSGAAATAIAGSAAIDKTNSVNDTNATRRTRPRGKRRMAGEPNLDRPVVGRERRIDLESSRCAQPAAKASMRKQQPAATTATQTQEKAKPSTVSHRLSHRVAPRGANKPGPNNHRAVQS